jgi:hypothetical protein
MGLFRRKRQLDPNAELPSDAPNADDEPVAEAEPAAAVRTPRRPVRRLPFALRPAALLGVVIVIVCGVLLLLYQQNQLPNEVLVWWPLALIVTGLVWFLLGLVRRSGNGLLGGAVLMGTGVSVQLSALSVYTVGSTLVGIVFISAGTAILLRGILMGRQPIRL